MLEERAEECPTESSAAVSGRLRDSFGRAITDLRISVTDRCNYKCVYCRTGNEGAQYTELAIADYLRMVRRFVSLGVEKIRLTGGEPLLRHGLVEMVSELAQMRAEMQTFRDDMTVLTAIAVRLENSMNSLAGQVGTMVQQHRRFNERLSRLENAE